MNANVLSQMITLFLMMSIGFACNKCKIMNEAFNKYLSKFILYVSLPSMIIAAVLGTDHTLPNSKVFILLALAAGMYVFLILLSIFFAWIMKCPKETKGIYICLFIFSNIGFMGFPVVKVLYGDIAVFYASIFQIPFALLSYTLGAGLISKQKPTLNNFRRALLQPGIISAIIAILFYLLNMSMPTVLFNVFDYLGSMTTPASMLIIGSTIACYPLKKVFVSWRLYIMSVIKQLAFPFVLWLIIRDLPIDPMMIGVTVMLTAMPVATNCTMFCHEYNADAELASAAVFLSTVISVVTIPIISSILV